MKLIQTTALGSVLGFALTASVVTAAAQENTAAESEMQEAGENAEMTEMQEASAEPDNEPYTMPDDAFVTLTGKVTQATADSFELDYGGATTVTVEMDDWSNWGDAYGIVDGEWVSVIGQIDDDFLEATTIEASSVYLESLNTNFYASSAEEEALRTWRPYAPVDTNSVTFTGVVAETMPVQGEFIIDTGYYDLEIDADSEKLGYNPLDNEGFQEVSVGDIVTVTGDLNDPLFEEKELEASLLTTSAS